MRLIEKLMAKRDAAHAEYVKWNGLIEMLQTDPEFASIVHYGATKTMTAAKTLALASGTYTPEVRAKVSKAQWTPERRAKQSKLMRKLAKVGKNPAQWTKGRKVTDAERAKVSKNNGSRTLTPEQRKAISDRMKRLRADPAYEARRLASLRKSIKARQAAQT